MMGLSVAMDGEIEGLNVKGITGAKARRIAGGMRSDSSPSSSALPTNFAKSEAAEIGFR
jgi:hypothetical protein